MNAISMIKGRRLAVLLIVLLPLVLWSMQEVLAQHPFSLQGSNDDKKNDTAQFLPVLSILEAKDFIGQTVRVQGIVTTDELTVQGGKKSVHIQDTTGGLHLYGYEGDSLRKGDQVRVTGFIAGGKGLMEIRPIEGGLQLLRTDQVVPPAKVLTDSDLRNARKLEALKGTRVTVTAQLHEFPQAARDGAVQIPLQVGEGRQFTLCFTEETFNPAQLKPGAVYEVTGILSQNRQYQILPRHIDDLSLISPPRG